MALEEYSPKALRIIMTARGLNAGDIAKRTGGRVGRTTVRNVVTGERPTAQEKTLEAILERNSLGNRERSLTL
jgi:hypothetical protein